MAHITQDSMNQWVADSDIGAGNFLQAIVTQTNEVTVEQIFLEQPLLGFNNHFYPHFSRQSLLDLTKQWASYYLQCGVNKEEVIAIYLENTFDYFIQFIALTSIGAIPAFINGTLDISTTANYLVHINAEKVLITKERAQQLQPYLTNIQTICILEDILQKTDFLSYTLPSWYPHQPKAADPILLTHTSGTTGVPKAVIAGHQAFLYGVKYRLKQPIEGTNRYLTALPHAHNSSVAYLMEAIIRGCLIHVQSDKNPTALATAIHTFQPNLVIAFPKYLVNLCRIDCTKYNFDSVHYWRSTGDAAHERHVRIITSWGTHHKAGKIETGSYYIDGLGSSEMGSSLFTIIHHSEKRNYNRCIGRPQPWVEAVIFNESGQKLPALAVGRLGVKSPSLTQGYWNNEVLTKKSWIDNYWITGDLAFYNQRGDFYHVDRLSDTFMTKRGKIYSLLTEESIMRYFYDIFDCSIFLIQETESLAGIYVELIPAAQTRWQTKSLLDAINQWLCQENLTPLDQLIIVTNQEEIPQGVTGKVLKRLLREINIDN